MIPDLTGAGAEEVKLSPHYVDASHQGFPDLWVNTAIVELLQVLFPEGDHQKIVAFSQHSRESTGEDRDGRAKNMTSRGYNQLQKKTMVVGDRNAEMAKGRLRKVDDF